MRSMALRSGGGMAADVPWSLDQLGAKPSTVVGKIGSHNLSVFSTRVGVDRTEENCRAGKIRFLHTGGGRPEIKQ